MNRKNTFVAAAGACLYLIAIGVMYYIVEAFNISNSNDSYRNAIGIITLIAAVFCGGLPFFMFAHDEDFAWATMIPVIPSLILAYFATEFLNDKMYPPMETELSWAVLILGIAFAAVMPIQKIKSIAFAAKALGILFYVLQIFLPYILGAWTILLCSILGALITTAGYFFGIEDINQHESSRSYR